MKLADFIHRTRNEKKIRLFFDIETLQYNEDEGYKHPSDFKNEVYIVGVGFEYRGETYIDIFPNFKDFIGTIDGAYKGKKARPRMDLISHNGNKYDNHYLRKSLIEDFNLPVGNLWVMNVENDDINSNSYSIKDLTQEQKQGIVLEKRIKSSVNLEMTIFFKGQQINTIDNYLKTNASIEVLGKKLMDLGLISLEETKGDYDYDKYNVGNDMSKEEAEEYALSIYNNLSDDELDYVKNDVLILAKSAEHYSTIFEGYDYSKYTFTSNILDAYNSNNLTSLQLLNKVVNVNNKRDRVDIRYTDYYIRDRNFYDWLRPFYRGGLNMYNTKHLGKIVNDVMGMDINSSYPYAMHNFKIPTFIKDFSEYKEPTPVKVELSHDTYTLYQVTKQEFDDKIASKLGSRVLRQMLVKYYNTNDTVNINSYTFRLLEEVAGLKIDEIEVLATVEFETEYFGSRDKIEELYYIKTQGSNDYEIEYNSPYDIKVTDRPNKHKMSKPEVDIAKVNLNGLYGIPALRAFFGMHTANSDGTYTKHNNGFRNSERNVVFSIFTTSVALYNLLKPFKYLTTREIDDNFLYADTDSLYFKKVIQDKLPMDLFDPNELGKWDLEHDNIKKFFVLNHKKYTFVNEEGEIDVKSGGVPADSYNTDMTFEEFIETQFSDGSVLDSTGSTYTKAGTVAIYTSKMVMEKGTSYMNMMYNPRAEKMKQLIIEEVRNTLTEEEHADDLLFIETPFGTLSKADLYPYENQVHEYSDIYELIMKQEVVRRKLGM